jgi:iron complex outermembrane recepter protein
MKKFVLCLGGLFASFGLVAAQSTVTGDIYAINPKRPVAFAFVQLSDSLGKYWATTNENGKFEITRVKSGTYTVLVGHIEYKPHKQSLQVFGPKVSCEFQLKSTVEYLDASIISGVRASALTPVTATNLNQAQIEESDQQKDFPFLLNLTPSTVISSDAGNGVGYTGVRVRGIDPTRVNVTVNGIPLNDAESQGVYWVNLPDLASSSESVQIQRGIGASTNGGAAFGASVNIRTNDLDTLKRTRVVLGTGSFSTNRVSLVHNSGRLKGNWGYLLRGSIIESEGFIDRASSDLKSANVVVAKYWNKASLKANILLGSERTYQAWWGIPQPKFKGDMAETNRYIKQLYISGNDLDNLTLSNSKTYNYYTYENEVDNYNQNHYQLFHDYKVNNKWAVNSALYATTGKGYFEQFRAKDYFSNYKMSNQIVGSDTLAQADMVRRRWLDNTLVGLITNAQYKTAKWNTTFGIGYNTYFGRHFGEVVATEFTNYNDLNHIYYDNDSRKSATNAYAKASYRLGKWVPYLDLQIRRVDYSFEGLDNNLEFGNQKVNYSFINPKIGVTYNQKWSRFYATFAQGNREPVRDDFRNNKPSDWPEHEHLDNVELGYRYAKGRKQFGVTLYHMDYTNQLVLTGAVNDVGEAVRTNVESSYRQGVEFEWQFPLSKSLQVGGNLTLAKNQISSFTEFVGEWDDDFEIVSTQYENTNISFSPATIGSAVLSYKLSKECRIVFSSKYVGEQFLDNMESDDRALPSFKNIDFALLYSSTISNGKTGLDLGLYMNNILNEFYAPNGYTYSGIIANQRQNFNYLYPMAGRNMMLKASLKL